MYQPARSEIECRLLVDLLESQRIDATREVWPHERKAINQFLLDDLAGRLRFVNEEFASEIVSKVNEKFRSELTRFRDVDGAVGLQRGEVLPTQRPSQSGEKKKHYADVIIVTILAVERDAVLAVFGRRSNEKEDYFHDGRRYYRAEVDSQRYGGKINVWITMVGMPRNVPCAEFVSQLHDHFEFGTVILVGIAGGNKDKCNLGDVVASTEILDDDGGVDYPTHGFRLGRYWFGIRRHQPRVKIFDNPGSLTNVLNGFSISKSIWHEQIRQIIRGGDFGAIKFDAGDIELSPDFHYPAVIQAGERLKRDGGLPNTALQYTDKLYAVEMEGSGFAQACRKKYEWMVVRGISDFGDVNKRDKKQSFAALSASVAVRQFLETEFAKLPYSEVPF